MSSAEIAVKVIKELEPEDFRVLSAIEIDMSRYRYVPEKDIIKISRLPEDEVKYRLSKLDDLRLIYRWVGPYVGYSLNMAGYDCLALNALVKAEILEAFGKPLGVGKESDVYDAITPRGERVAVKIHRLGRTSFRQTRRLRGYVADRRHISWLYQSRLAAEREYEALRILYPCGVAVPRPIGWNRHIVVMGMIEGEELSRFIEIPNPEEVLDEIIMNVRRAYVDAGIVHADLSEFNIILKPDWHILIIDWPQYVKLGHPNIDFLLERDIKNILRFFHRKFGVERDLEGTLNYVKSRGD